MLEKIIDFGLKQRILVLSLTGVLVFIGIQSALNLPIDAIPDVTNVQVQINTNTGSLSPVESERQVTLPIEQSMFGLPNLEQIRSLSKYGLSQVTVVFEEGTDIYFARQQVQERLQHAREEIPDGVEAPEMGPISSGLGEIFHYTIESDSLTAMELRTLQDWIVAPQLRSTPGIAEVNSFGGYEKQYQVIVNPDALVQYNLDLEDVLSAVEQNNVNATGGYLVRGAEQLIIRGVGQIHQLEHIEGIVIASRNGVPVRVSDVAEVAVGSTLRQGAVTKDGDGEVVTGIVMMRMGANARTVVQDLKVRVAQVQRTLPDGVSLKSFYDRTDLINSTINTVKTNLFEGAVLVIAVLFLLLGSIRGAVIVALSIPLSMMFAVSAMGKAGIAGSLMSLGAIDFGLVVDGSVVMVDNAVRRLGSRKDDESYIKVLRDACVEVARPIFFGIGIIIIVYIPILTLEGVEGKMFRPMAFTVVFALIGSLIVTFLLTPLLVALGMRGSIKEKEVWLVRRIRQFYEPALHWAVTHARPMLAGVSLAVAGSVVAVPFLGAEFMPRLDEGSFALQVMRLPSVSLEEAIRQSGQVERLLLEEFPDEVSDVVSKTGRAEIATDPMGVNISDVFVMLHPRKQWKRASSKDELESRITDVLEKIPGVAFNVSQPIELRVNELVAGVRSDLAVKIFGDDLDTLEAVGAQIVFQVSRIPGAMGFKAQQASGLPQIEIKLDPNRLARHGVSAERVMQTIEALNGLEATQVIEGQRRFALAVRYPEHIRQNRDRIEGLLISTATGGRIPVADLATFSELLGPAEISHEDGSRVLIVEGNVRDRDIAGFVDDVRDLIEGGQVKLPPGYRVSFGGQFENLERATKRLVVVVPIALFMIFILLFSAFNSLRHAVLVFTGIPFAAVGGIIALMLRGMPLSISAGVGFIALFGVAVLNGVVLVAYINDLRKLGMTVEDAVIKGGISRLRPVLMTALVASLGFVPMALSTGAGAEVQRPLATVVIGGLLTSTLLTLLVLPVLYQHFGVARDEKLSDAV